MSLASDELVSANGWQEFEKADNTKTNQDYLDFTHKVARVFNSTEGKEILDIMVSKYLLCDIAQPNDTQIQIGIRQGRASLVKQILGQIEISNNTK